SRGIRSDFDIFPAWVDLGFREIKLEDFQVRKLVEPGELKLMMSTPARGSFFRQFYEDAILGVPYRALQVGDTAWTFRGGIARPFEIASFEDGGVLDTTGAWHKHAYETAEAAEEAANRRKQWSTT
ncbi:MAG TPA: hypothetical protein VLA34_08640, partial [Candidatus Krumholzibacterium sp.]|nr:hypothetical protein [Candidatus Krumholzibacterium sp.]